MKDFIKTQLLKLNKRDYSLLVLNFIAFIFGIVFSTVQANAVLSSLATVLVVVTVLVDILYFSTVKNIFGTIAPIILALFALINFACISIIGLSIFANSKSIIGIIVYVMLPIIAIVFIIVGKLYVGKQRKEKSKIAKTINIVITVGLLSALLAFFIVGAIALSGTTAINTNIVNMVFPLIILVVVVFSLFLRFASEHKAKIKGITILIATVLVVVTISQFAVIEGSAMVDMNRNKAEFLKAFGTVERDKLIDPRLSDYNLAEVFTGIETKNYKLQRDIEYYVGQDELEQDLKLKYDVYYPTFDGAHKAVLLNLHGSGGDKDIGNYAHRNKYFASRGYVVYDIQFGDFNEKDINFHIEIRNSEYMLAHIDAFFNYAVAHNDIGADFSNTFLTGVSMGGGLVSKYAYSFDNSLDEMDIDLKGIIPVYPGYSVRDSGINNYLNYVTKDSVPCLLIMSLSDVVVGRDVVKYTREAFDKVGNNSFACIGISFSGHGSDSLVSGRFNQSYMYYAERFMQILST